MWILNTARLPWGLLDKVDYGYTKYPLVFPHRWWQIFLFSLNSFFFFCGRFPVTFHCVAAFLLFQLFNCYCFNNGLPLSLRSSSLTRQAGQINRFCLCCTDWMLQAPALAAVCKHCHLLVGAATTVGVVRGAHKQHAREAATVITERQNSNGISNN